MSARFMAANPAFATRVRDGCGRQGAMALIGAELVHLDAGAADVAVAFRPDLAQQHGYFHGGIVGMIADSAGGYAAFSLMPAGASVLTVEYKINLLAPARGGRRLAPGPGAEPGRPRPACHVPVGGVPAGRGTAGAPAVQTPSAMS